MIRASNKLFRAYLSSMNKIQGLLDTSRDLRNRETNIGERRMKFSRKMVNKILSARCTVGSKATTLSCNRKMKK